MTDTDPIVILVDEDFAALVNEIYAQTDLTDGDTATVRMTLRRMLPELLRRRLAERTKPGLRLVALSRKEGGLVWINPAGVVGLYTSDDGGTAIVTSSGRTPLCVNQPADEVAAALTGAAPPPALLAAAKKALDLLGVDAPNAAARTLEDAIAEAAPQPADPLRDAASDLLDALRRVMRHIPNDAGGASLGDDMHRARRAIAKAEGIQADPLRDAASDMLAALRAVLSLSAPTAEVEAQVRAAIAKAEGRGLTMPYVPTVAEAEALATGARRPHPGGAQPKREPMHPTPACYWDNSPKRQDGGGPMRVANIFHRDHPGRLVLQIRGYGYYVDAIAAEIAAGSA